MISRIPDNGNQGIKDSVPGVFSYFKYNIVILFYYTVPTELKGVFFFAGRMYACSLVRSCVGQSSNENVRLCTANKWLDLEAQLFCPHMHIARYVFLPILIQIVKSFDLNFHGQIWINYIGKCIHEISMKFASVFFKARRTIPIATMSRVVRSWGGQYLSPRYIKGC